MIVVWLEWPEKCFRIDAEALRRLKAVVPPGMKVVRVRTERAFVRALPQATHALVWNFKREWFARAPRLRVLATPAAGRELVPEDAPPGVTVHFGTFHGPIIAESVLAFIFAWARGFFRPELKTLSWPRTEISDKCYVVKGTCAVILGFGHIGRAIGRVLEENGVSVTGYTRHGLYRGDATFLSRENEVTTTLNAALAHADWLILALPSTTGTDKLVNAKLLARLPRRCVVINIGRGNAIDERALDAALESGKIAGAYLDVRRQEPSGTVIDVPDAVPGLADRPNCIVMPHASAFDRGYLAACIDELAEEGLLK